MREADPAGAISAGRQHCVSYRCDASEASRGTQLVFLQQERLPDNDPSERHRATFEPGRCADHLEPGALQSPSQIRGRCHFPLSVHRLRHAVHGEPVSVKGHASNWQHGVTELLVLSSLQVEF